MVIAINRNLLLFLPYIPHLNLPSLLELIDKLPSIIISRSSDSLSPLPVTFYLPSIFHFCYRHNSAIFLNIEYLHIAIPALHLTLGSLLRVSIKGATEGGHGFDPEKEHGPTSSYKGCMYCTSCNHQVFA
jgi:hypothetical protein